ncbi:MAG: metallophosphoesterase [Ruminococcus sp.]|uniref:metallophosphoesterase family protein n=1 Tax=Ruminococcus sp. TaxID=41978 RepID=UPI0028731C7E|nr:metallophosphoesterase [Ruminococcus sp.]MBQ3284182.1 metallophosphoesterase [Ruminococcus sp.]
MTTSEKHYRFALLADIHIDLENGGRNIYFIHAQKNLARALEVIKERDCGFIISAGDQVTNATGAKEEWRRYREIVDRSDYSGLILEAMGNHELRYAKYGGCTVDECREEFLTYTRLDDKPVIRDKGKTYYAYLDDTFGDAYLFLALEYSSDTPLTDNFSKEQMDWTERMLERFTREKRRIFVIQHVPFHAFGAGDDNDNPAYGGNMYLSDESGRPFAGNSRFYDLIHRYRDVIWLSGHTHIDLRDEVNYSTAHGTACQMLHIPALAGSTRIATANGKRGLDRTFYGDVSQGYIADVYEDRVVFTGIDFLSDRLYPEYTYVIKR